MSLRPWFASSRARLRSGPGGRPCCCSGNGKAAPRQRQRRSRRLRRPDSCDNQTRTYADPTEEPPAMPRYDFDLFTIGAGSGGVAGSRRAGSYGARTAICEELRIGGTCVLRGCVPKKLLVYGSEFASAFADAEGYGWSVPETEHEWGALIAAKDKELDRLHGIYVNML